MNRSNLWSAGKYDFQCLILHRAAPIQRAILSGDQKSGVTIMQMDAGLDTGDMLYKLECDITDVETSSTLHDKLCQLGPDALLKTIALLPLFFHRYALLAKFAPTARYNK